MPGLEPFSEYRLTVSVYNKKGNGPNSDPVTFRTPEGGQLGSPRLPDSKCYVALMADAGDRVRAPTQSWEEKPEPRMKCWKSNTPTGTLRTRGKHGQGDRLTHRRANSQEHLEHLTEMGGRTELLYTGEATLRGSRWQQPGETPGRLRNDKGENNLIKTV